MPLSLTTTPTFTPPQLQVFRRHEQQPPIMCLSSVSDQHGQPPSRTRGIFAAPTTVNGSVSSIVTGGQKEKLEDEDELLVADCWPELHGGSDWEGLLDPMNPLLRRELIRYGEMAQACYDAFDKDPFSKFSGSSKYSESEFFQGLAMEKTGYKVTRFLYATALADYLPKSFLKAIWPSEEWSEKTNWMGYVAVSDDETSKRLGRRDICIAWRGTVTQLEWVNDLKDFLGTVSANKIPSPDRDVKVESGFLSLYTNTNQTCRFCKYSARQQILTEINRLIEKYPDEELSITVTGHSLGSSLAILSAYDIAETGVNIRAYKLPVPICVFSFAGPRVGNDRFRSRLIESLGVKVLRVINVHDVVPAAPGIFINENSPKVVMNVAWSFPWSYTHVGVELALNHNNSPFLRRENNIVHAHDLEVHLHLLDGYHGKGHKFELATGRDHALVNKYTDFLEEHCKIPPNWKQDENRGMVRDREGRWVQRVRPKLEDHPIDMPLHLEQLGLS